jgi:hypothetical protein
MKHGGLRFALAAVVLIFAPPSAVAGALKSEYIVSVRGFPVGTALLRAERGDGHYKVEFSARAAGLARLFSDIEVSAHASGLLAEDRPRPDGYGHVWVEDGETEKVQMRFKGRSVTEIGLDPPRERPQRYVPITREQKADVFDPVSAFLWPAPEGAVPSVCDRTLPLIDGKIRFDIELAFLREARFEPRGGERSQPAIVCSLRYRPVSGHRKNKKDDGFMREDAEAEVWMAAAGDGLVVPVRVEIDSRAGRVVLQARILEPD